jgi:hypothetical protein
MLNFDHLAIQYTGPSTAPMAFEFVLPDFKLRFEVRILPDHGIHLVDK